MRKSIQEQVAGNKRASLLYAFVIVLLLAGLGAAIVGVYSAPNWYLGAVCAAGFGILVGFVARFGGTGIVLSISRARQATPYEEQVVNNVAEEMAIAAGLPKPEVYIIDDPAPNAFATGMDPARSVIVVTTGLLAMMNREELQGVIAHEMSHIRNYDIRFSTEIAIIAGLVPLLADFFRWNAWWGGGRDRDRNDSGLGTVFFVVGLVLSILAPLFALMLQFAISRQREYLADASAAELTRYPAGLMSALEKIENAGMPLKSANRATQHLYIVNPFKVMRKSMVGAFDTHPPIEERIQRLAEMAGQPGALGSGENG